MTQSVTMGDGANDRGAGAQALIAGDMLIPYFVAAQESMPESKIMEVLDECGIEGLSNLKNFQGRLRSEVHFPIALFEAVGQGLINAGMVQERAMYYSHTRRISLRSVTKMNLTLMSELAKQELGRNLNDVVTISILRSGIYDPIFINSICGDGVLEERRGNRRKTRVIFMLVHPDVVSWFWFNHCKWMAVYAPTNMGEPKAEVKMNTGDDFIKSDPQRPDHPLRLTAVPSIRQIADQHGIDMTVAENMVCFDGKAVAIADRCPGRVVDGVYRMIQDVRLDNGRVVIEKPKDLVRPYHSRLLHDDHRYHLDQSFPLYEAEMDFTIHRVRQTAFSASLVMSRKLWTFVTGSDVNPWRGLLKLTERRDASDVEREIDAHLQRSCGPAREAPALLPVHHQVAYYKSQFNLTDRESEVLEMIVDGKTNREIALELSISELTVKSHVSHLLSKTGFSSRQKLMAGFNNA